jgi:hypothetical protein
MDFALIAYILFSFVVGVGGTYQIIQLQRPIAATMYLIGSILVLLFFGLRWFTGETFNLGRLNTDRWPPVINLCPDFLTLYERTKDGVKEKVCVDLIGIAPAGGIRKLLSPEQTAGQNADNYIFKLYPNLSGRKRTNALCLECKNKKVTWEGLYDGSTCVVTGLAPGGDAESSECPAPDPEE